MKKVLFFSMFVLLTILVSAEDLNCQYPEIIYYTENVRVLVYEGTNEYGAEDLTFSGFTEGEIVTFVIKNPNDFRVRVVLNYTINGTGAKDIKYGKWIEPNNNIQIREACRDGENLGNCSINKDSLIYYVDQPKAMYPQVIPIKKTKPICLGKNDGELCTSAQECGSKNCNFAGFCGNFVNCPVNQTRCNNSCLTPSTKNTGDSYLCEWECISGVGKEGVCVMNKSEITKYWTYFIIISLLIVLGIICIIWYIKYKQIKELTTKIKELEKNITSLKHNIDHLNKDISKLKDEHKDGEIKIDELKEKIKNAEGEAKKKIEEELEKEKKNQKERIDNLKKEENKLKDREKTLKDEENSLHSKEEELKLKDYDHYIKIQLAEYQRQYGRAGITVYYDSTEKYIKIRYSSGRIEFLHRYIYKQQVDERLSSEMEVHHIDCNQLNDDLWNLIAIPKEKHSIITHGKIKKGDWMTGYNELKHKLNKQDDDFPKHIREHFNNTD